MIVVVPVDPPRDGLVLTRLVESTPLTDREAVTLYRATVSDVFRATTESGGDLLVNYRDDETLPDEHAGDDPAGDVRDLASDALGDLDDVRFERQVGSTRAARMGNTVTHLLEREGASSVAVLDPTAALVTRTEIDGAAMSLRRHDVVLGPATGGNVSIACFGEPIDFTDASESPALATLAQRGADAGLQVGFAPTVPTVETSTGLAATIAGIEARAAAGREVAPATAAAIADLALSVGADGEIEHRETDNAF
ncbi:hypothetical protein OB905_12650 [Halobacteria archaeon AArc-dxtr1]|nr:hypothetical protein [Halobacteria archaeon AArc-dxtr1]